MARRCCGCGGPGGSLPETAQTGRWAVYYAPPAAHPVWRLGCRWLGRDPESGEVFPPPDLLAAPRWRATVARPAHYGFHATLRPPMPLPPGTDAGELRQAVAAIAAGHQPFVLTGLHIARLGAFLALCPSPASPAMEALAADCVRRLDPLRAPGPLRPEAGLSRRQRALQARWGYPFVLDEFRCHLTLTGPVAAAEAASMAEVLERFFPAGVLARPVPVDALALYHQPDRGTPFRLVERMPLGAG